MALFVPKQLITLAQLFKRNGEKLYLVGGFIRNQLVGVKDSDNIDIDVCGSCSCEKIIKFCEKTDFKVKYKSEEFGVLAITNGITVEYARFRQDIYNLNGVHIPQNVEFITDLNKDANRRDFRCNAVYYDILEEEFIDPLDGLGDIGKKIVRTTLKPDDVFKGDGERILRMIRVAITLGFGIDEKTYESAKRNIRKLENLSMARIRDEFSQIVLADTEYPYLSDTKMAHARGVNMLADLGALKYILPALEDIRQSGIIEDTGKPLFEHVMNVFAFSRPEVRLSALLHDVGKAKAKLNYGNFNGEEEYAQVIIEKNLGLNGLNYSKKIVERVKKVVLGVNFDKFGLEIAKNVRHFIFENYENINLIIHLKNAISMDKTSRHRLSYSAGILKKHLEKMEKNNTPLTLDRLNIKGDMLIRAFPELRIDKTGELLNKLQYICIDKPRLNNEIDLLKTAEKLINKRKSIYKE